MSCRNVSLCGTTVYCSWDCDVGPSCDPGQIQFDGACPPNQVCEERTSCGETVYCGEEPVCESAAPCTGSPSPVVQSGEGLCPPVLPGPDPHDNCYVENACGYITHCITACDLNHYVVSDPTECDEDGACYPARGEGVEVWCTGEAVNCEAEPFCEEEEIQMTVGEVCLSDWRCRIVEACRTAIQCGHFVGDDD